MALFPCLECRTNPLITFAICYSPDQLKEHVAEKHMGAIFQFECVRCKQKWISSKLANLHRERDKCDGSISFCPCDESKVNIVTRKCEENQLAYIKSVFQYYEGQFPTNPLASDPELPILGAAQIMMNMQRMNELMNPKMPMVATPLMTPNVPQFKFNPVPVNFNQSHSFDVPSTSNKGQTLIKLEPESPPDQNKSSSGAVSQRLSKQRLDGSENVAHPLEIVAKEEDDIVIGHNLIQSTSDQCQDYSSVTLSHSSSDEPQDHEVNCHSPEPTLSTPDNREFLNPEEHRRNDAQPLTNELFEYEKLINEIQSMGSNEAPINRKDNIEENRTWNATPLNPPTLLNVSLRTAADADLPLNSVPSPINGCGDAYSAHVATDCQLLQKDAYYGMDVDPYAPPRLVYPTLSKNKEPLPEVCSEKTINMKGSRERQRSRSRHSRRVNKDTERSRSRHHFKENSSKRRRDSRSSSQSNRSKRRNRSRSSERTRKRPTSKWNTSDSGTRLSSHRKSSNTTANSSSVPVSCSHESASKEYCSPDFTPIFKSDARYSSHLNNLNTEASQDSVSEIMCRQEPAQSDNCSSDITRKRDNKSNEKPLEKAKANIKNIEWKLMTDNLLNRNRKENKQKTLDAEGKINVSSSFPPSRFESTLRYPRRSFWDSGIEQNSKDNQTKSIESEKDTTISDLPMTPLTRRTLLPSPAIAPSESHNIRKPRIVRHMGESEYPSEESQEHPQEWNAAWDEWRYTFYMRYGYDYFGYYQGYDGASCFYDYEKQTWVQYGEDGEVYPYAGEDKVQSIDPEVLTNVQECVECLVNEVVLSDFVREITKDIEITTTDIGNCRKYVHSQVPDDMVPSIKLEIDSECENMLLIDDILSNDSFDDEIENEIEQAMLNVQSIKEERENETEDEYSDEFD